MRRTRWISITVMLIVLIPFGTASAGPVQPQAITQLGSPDRLAPYWHDQRWVPGDEMACALYAQASVLEALGYDFAAELAAARDLGLRDGWYSPETGSTGLGQPLRARRVPFDVFGTPVANGLTPDRALLRLQFELLSGHFVIANIDAQQLRYYRGSAIKWHTLWITGLRLDADGQPLAVVANDSYHGARVEYPIDEFMAAWGTPAFNFYAIFVHEVR
jgi:hypothetical protein